MSSAYEPVAEINADDQGAVNTVTTICLIVTSLLLSAIRYAIGRKRVLKLEADDAVYAVATVLSIITSIVSQRMVSPGLGRHQDTLSAETLSEFFKVQYATHFLVIMSMAACKMSVALFYHRIVRGTTQESSTMKLLLPLGLIYGIAGMFLVAFQCDPPQTWALESGSCSSGRRMHYGAIALNILTDVLLAVWIVPTIWTLKVTRSTKAIIMSLMLSRLLICAGDVGRIALVQRTLESDDVTWNSLGWAVMDQLMVHLSLNHATLPRLNNFFGSLQTGLLNARLTAGGDVTTASYGAGRRYRTGTSEYSNSKIARSGFFHRTTTGQSVGILPDAHGSETHLCFEGRPNENGISTFVTVGDTTLSQQNQGIITMHRTVEIQETQT